MAYSAAFGSSVTMMRILPCSRFVAAGEGGGFPRELAVQVAGWLVAVGQHQVGDDGARSTLLLAGQLRRPVLATFPAAAARAMASMRFALCNNSCMSTGRSTFFCAVSVGVGL